MSEKTVADLEQELIVLESQGYRVAAELERLGQAMRNTNQAIMAKRQEIEAKKKEKPNG